MQTQIDTKTLYAITATKLNILSQHAKIFENIQIQAAEMMLVNYEKKRNTFFNCGKFFYKEKTKEQLMNSYIDYLLNNNLVLFDNFGNVFLSIDQPFKELLESVFTHNHHVNIISKLHEKLKVIINAKQNVQHLLTKEEAAILGI